MISITVDASDVTEALDKLDPKESAKAIKKAVSAGTKYLKPKVKVAAPRGKTGNLRKRVGTRTRKSRKDPAGSYYSVVRSFAPHHHLVVSGTRDRYTNSGAYRGRMPANDYVGRVADANADKALAIAEAELARQLDLD
jgi:hypothetical protein